MKLVIGATLSLAGWVFLVLVADVPSGLVHIPLAAGFVLLAAAIVNFGEDSE